MSLHDYAFYPDLHREPDRVHLLSLWCEALETYAQLSAAELEQWLYKTMVFVYADGSTWHYPRYVAVVQVAVQLGLAVDVWVYTYQNAMATLRAAASCSPSTLTPVEAHDPPAIHGHPNSA